MKEQRINDLLRAGAHDRLRRDLKKLGIRQRMKTLNKVIPEITGFTTESIDFFRKNFSVEIGALVKSGRDVEKAEALYRSANK